MVSIRLAREVRSLADSGHVEQVSVDPPHAGNGIGAQLISTAQDWARANGRRTITLTCFETVPWNAPYYARLGYVVVPDAEQPADLRAIRRAERLRGLDAWPRMAMQYRLL